MASALAVGRTLYGGDSIQLPEGTNVRDGIVLAGLDWQVHQHPLASSPDLDLVCDGCQHDGPLNRVPGWVANVRDDNGFVLSVTRSTYTPVQNYDALALADDLVHGGAMLDSIGSSPSGRKTFAALVLPAHIEVAGEEIRPLLYVVNSHDGSTGLRFRLSNLRLFCTNQLPGLWRNRGRRGVSFRHTRGVRQIEPIRQLLGLALASAEDEQMIGVEMSTIKVSEGAFLRYVRDELHPTPEDATPRVMRSRARAVEQHAMLYRAPHNANITGTAWGAYNVCVEYLDWARRGDHDVIRNAVDSQTLKLNLRAKLLAAVS